ncbi:hypothetical protein N9Z87_02015 [Amylibacter sp.]|nr:hypothetical protein [Amylibacter sp.]
MFGLENDPELVGQIYFRTDESGLDSNDYEVLDLYLGYLVSYLSRYDVTANSRVLLKFVGNSDPRGDAGYNKRLAMRRANSVKAVADKAFAPFKYYYSMSESKGEVSSDKNRNSRRVDIYSNVRIPRDEARHFDGEKIYGEYKGPKTNTFLIRTLIGASVDFYISGTVFSVEIKNAKTGRTRRFTYTGAGGGFGFSFNRPSGWTEVVLPLRMQIEDFSGNGSTVQLGTPNAFVTHLTFAGPRERGLYPKDITLKFKGVEAAIGAGGDEGYWHLRD